METIIATPTATGKQPEATKKCPKCGEAKPITEFNKNRRSKDGYQFYCKCCHAAMNANYHKGLSRLPTPTVAHYHPVFSKMKPREIITEIRERINFLRGSGWKYEGKLTYTKIEEVKL